MIKRTILPILSVLAPTLFLYWYSYGGDYPSLSLSIYLFFLMGLGWILAASVLLNYLLTRQLKHYLSIGTTTLLIENLVVFSCLSGFDNLYNFFSSWVCIINLLFIGAMIFIRIWNAQQKSDPDHRS